MYSYTAEGELPPAGSAHAQCAAVVAVCLHLGFPLHHKYYDAILICFPQLDLDKGFPKTSHQTCSGLFIHRHETHPSPAVKQLFLSFPPPCADQGRTLASDSLFISDAGPSAAANCQHLQPSPIRARKAIPPRGRPRVLPLNNAAKPGLQGFDPTFGLGLHTASPTSLQQGQLGCVFWVNSCSSLWLKVSKNP